MNTLLKSLVLVSVATVCSQGLAQVYESRDAEGRPVFSDRLSPDAKPIDAAPTNAVAVKPLQPGQTDPPKPAAAPPAGSRDYVWKIEREMEAYRREEDRREHDRHSEQRHEVGHDASHDASERPREVGHDANEKRHEVGHDGSEQRY